MSSEAGQNPKSYLKAFAKDSLKETLGSGEESVAQGEPSSPERTQSTSSASKMAIPETEEVTKSAANKIKKTEGSPTTTKSRTAQPQAATPTANPATPSSGPSSKKAQRQPPPTNDWEEAGAPKIPADLTEEEKEVYRRLITVRKARMFTEPEPTPPPNVEVITDLGKDYDDLAAMIILKELHRLGLVKLQGFIANLHPPQDRARFGRGCLDLLGLHEIPIAWGEEAAADPKKRTPPKNYEFPLSEPYFKPIWGKEPVFTPYDQDKSSDTEIESGVRLLDRHVNERLPNDSKKPKLTLLLISGLADIATFAKREPGNLAKVTENVVFQGDYSIQQGPFSYHAILTPNLNAANNSFDRQAATEFHQYIDAHHIPSVVFTRAAATATKMPRQLFEDLSNTGHPLGNHLCEIQGEQDTGYYLNACGPEEQRFLKDRDQNWFLDYKTDWYQKHPEDMAHREDPSTKPVGKAILPYVQLVFYDVLAALGAAGYDVIQELNLLEPLELFENQGPHIHKIVGVEDVKDENGVVIQKGVPGVNVDKMKTTISALMKGSLMAVQEGLPSKHTSQASWVMANRLAREQAQKNAALEVESAAIGTGSRT